MPTALVTGGAGYIGSHTLRALSAAGWDLLVYDSLEKGHPPAVANYRLVVGDTADGPKLDHVFREHAVDAVVHFAAYIEAGESVRDPARYFRNNTAGTLSLLESMVRNSVSKLVFSSTAAVYGDPERVPIEEADRKQPTNPYGESKLMVERMLDAFDRAYGLHSISLRYFNAAGADPQGAIGEDHHPETHLIPLVLEVALGQRGSIGVFGDDYPTRDGTCVRDYIHVVDLAAAHVLALQSLQGGAGRNAYNLGNGNGFTVREVIQAAREVTSHPIPEVGQPRRPGDPAQLVAASGRIQRELGWTPKIPDLKEIIASAWRWKQANPQGYGAAQARRPPGAGG
jgi:UDP-glucose 4-epimerase